MTEDFTSLEEMIAMRKREEAAELPRTDMIEGPKHPSWQRAKTAFSSDHVRNNGKF